MRVFITGASGFIGSAVVQELVKAGHQVIGLARSDDSANSLLAAGAEIHRGDLENLESLSSGAAKADGVLHLAFVHDFSRYADAGEIDRAAVEALGTALSGSDRPFVATSGIMVLKSGEVGTEADPGDSSSAAAIRVPSENYVLSLSSKGVRSSIVRLPPTVHGAGDQAFVPSLINVAREKGVSAYIGNGENRWAAVHRLDAAQLFRLALEKGVAGSKFHGVAETGIPFRKIAELIGRKLNIPVRSISPEEAAAHFDWLSFAVGVDNPATSEKTRESLSWRPTHPELFEDLEHSGYFND